MQLYVQYIQLLQKIYAQLLCGLSGSWHDHWHSQMNYMHVQIIQSLVIKKNPKMKDSQ